ncbi:MAG: hypothetical protein A2133_10160 [Actinobacteria bacterium RBG_16_64_13]|nr:MAG: hypothetical protein A2133_10160 [Actinobacteria bacterium RBG_16_64_13]
MWEQLTSTWQGMLSSLSWTEAIIALAFSLVFSLAAYFMYQLFYGSRHIGAGVHRMFLLGGPAITVLFLGIQTSIPLSLGLLGALSFVRFRTPVKDPAEIGFLLLLIASSIGAATGNFMVIALLMVVAFLVLGGNWLLRRRFAGGSRGGLMISLEQADFAQIEAKVKDFLATRLKGLKMESMSMVDGKVNLQYHYHKQPTFDWTAFTNELSALTAPSRLEIFVG